MPESAPESQSDNIADTPEAESEPAEVHKLTAEGTTDAMDPSEGFTEGEEGDGGIDYDELAPPHARMTGVRVSSRLQLQNITQCRAHPPPHRTSPGQAPAWHRIHPW